MQSDIKKRILALEFEDLIRSSYKDRALILTIKIYFSLVSSFGSVEKWPKDLKTLWIKVNRILYNDEILSEKKRSLYIYNLMKEKYFRLVGLSFPHKK